MTEVTPYPLKTQGFHHFLILLFYDHPAKGLPFLPAVIQRCTLYGMDDPCRPTCPVSPDCRFGSYTATVPSATYFFCLARKSGQKEALEADRVVPRCHRTSPSKNAAASTREFLCKATLQRRLRGNNAPIGNSFHARKEQNTLPWK